MFNFMFLQLLLFPLSQGQIQDSGSTFSSSSPDIKVVGGSLAAPGEFPYQVFIEKIWNSTKIYKCGGTIISPDFVLTAAHCLHFQDFGGQLASPKRVWVTAGVTDLTIKRDPWKQEIRAEELIPHPNFKFENGSNAERSISYPIYDIGLIRLHKRLNFTERVGPIGLPDSSNFPLKGNGTLTGWGRPNFNERWSKQLRKVGIPLLEWERCAKIFTGVDFRKEMFCSGTKEGGITPCNGDSGGPITCTTSEEDEERVICGIATFGGKGCVNYSVYTRVSSYLDWIGSVMKSNYE